MRREGKEEKAKEKELTNEKDKKGEKNKEKKRRVFMQKSNVKKAMYKEVYLNNNKLNITLYSVFSFWFKNLITFPKKCPTQIAIN